MCSDFWPPPIQIGSVSLQEHLEKIIALRFESMEKSIYEARRLMEDRMNGFPSAFAQKGDMANTAIGLKELKDKDLKELKNKIDAKLGRDEYEQKHSNIIDKIESANKEINDLKTLRADIQGRIIATGGVVVFIIALVQIMTQIIFHIYWSK